MSDSVPDDLTASLAEAILAGRKIEAIKLYRESTRCGLKEAKEQVEAIEAHLRQTHPEKFSTPASSGTGCLGSLLMLVGLTVGGIEMTIFRFGW